MGAYEMLKDAAKLAQRADNIELTRKLLDAQAASLEDRERIRALTEENAELRARLKLQGEMRWNPERHVYYRHVEGAEPEGPYCATCWTTHQRVANLAEWEGDRYWHCVACIAVVPRPGMASPKPPRREHPRSGWLDR